MTEKRPYGTGTVTSYKLKHEERWRIRLPMFDLAGKRIPKKDRKEYCGFLSKEQAMAALWDAISGVSLPKQRHTVPTKRDLDCLLNQARKLAAKLGVPLEIRT